MQAAMSLQFCVHFVHDHTFMSLLLKRGMQFESTIYLHIRMSKRLIRIKKYFL